MYVLNTYIQMPNYDLAGASHGAHIPSVLVPQGRRFCLAVGSAKVSCDKRLELTAYTGFVCMLP